MEFIAGVNNIENQVLPRAKRTLLPRRCKSRLNRDIHIFTDCQEAIVLAFGNQIPSNKIEIITSIKQHINQISEKGNKIHVHWVPGHKVEGVLAREGVNTGIIDIKVLSGNIEGISKEARSELVGALLNFIKCTKRFK